MAHEFMFNLDTDFLQVAAGEVMIIALCTIEECKVKNEEIPPKFERAAEGLLKMLQLKPVSKTEIQSILDTIGGYYSAMVVYTEKYGGTDEEIKHAEELMRFASLLEENVRPVWGLELVKS